MIIAKQSQVREDITEVGLNDIVTLKSGLKAKVVACYETDPGKEPKVKVDVNFNN